MIPAPLLVDAALAAAGLFLATWVVILGHGVARAIRRTRRPRLERGRRLLAASLLDRGLDDDARRALRRLGPAEAAELFATFTPHLRGAEQEWLTEVAVDLGLVRRAGRMCRSRIWWRRLQGVRLLTLVGGEDDAVLALAEDPSPVVRSQVAEWAGAYPSEAGVRALIEMLGDPTRSSRYSVQDALVRLGGMAVEPLARRLASVTDPVAAVAGLRVAEGLGDPRLLPHVLDLADHADVEVRSAAFAALGALGGRAAADRLLAGLAEPVPACRAAAASALGRMGHWQAAPALARELGHTAWDVRLAAGRALARLGPPGEITLRRMLDAPNAFAADMARHVLDRAALDRTRTAPV